MRASGAGPDSVALELSNVVFRMKMLGLNTVRLPFSFVDLYDTPIRAYTSVPCIQACTLPLQEWVINRSGTCMGTRGQRYDSGLPFTLRCLTFTGRGTDAANREGGRHVGQALLDLPNNQFSPKSSICFNDSQANVEGGPPQCVSGVSFRVHGFQIWAQRASAKQNARSCRALPRILCMLLNQTLVPRYQGIEV